MNARLLKMLTLSALSLGLLASCGGDDEKKDEPNTPPAGDICTVNVCKDGYLTVCNNGTPAAAQKCENGCNIAGNGCKEGGNQGGNEGGNQGGNEGGNEGGDVNEGDSCDSKTFVQQCINDGANALICSNGEVVQWDCADPCQGPGSNEKNPLWVTCPKTSSSGGGNQGGNSGSYTAGAKCDYDTFSELCDGNKFVSCSLEGKITVDDCSTIVAGHPEFLCRSVEDFYDEGVDAADCVHPDNACTAEDAMAAMCATYEDGTYTDYYMCLETTTSNEYYYFNYDYEECDNGCDDEGVECAE